MLPDWAQWTLWGAGISAPIIALIAIPPLRSYIVSVFVKTVSWFKRIPARLKAKNKQYRQRLAEKISPDLPAIIEQAEQIESVPEVAFSESQRKVESIKEVISSLDANPARSEVYRGVREKVRKMRLMVFTTITRPNEVDTYDGVIFKGGPWQGQHSSGVSIDVIDSDGNRGTIFSFNLKEGENRDKFLPLFKYVVENLRRGYPYPPESVGDLYKRLCLAHEEEGVKVWKDAYSIIDHHTQIEQMFEELGRRLGVDGKDMEELRLTCNNVRTRDSFWVWDTLFEGQLSHEAMKHRIKEMNRRNEMRSKLPPPPSGSS